MKMRFVGSTVVLLALTGCGVSVESSTSTRPGEPTGTSGAPAEEEATAEPAVLGPSRAGQKGAALRSGEGFAEPPASEPPPAEPPPAEPPPAEPPPAEPPPAEPPPAEPPPAEPPPADPPPADPPPAEPPPAEPPPAEPPPAEPPPPPPVSCSSTVIEYAPFSPGVCSANVISSVTTPDVKTYTFRSANASQICISSAAIKLVSNLDPYCAWGANGGTDSLGKITVSGNKATVTINSGRMAGGCRKLLVTCSGTSTI